jgi:hypothetical protein
MSFPWITTWPPTNSGAPSGCWFIAPSGAPVWASRNAYFLVVRLDGEGDHHEVLRGLNTVEHARVGRRDHLPLPRSGSGGQIEPAYRAVQIQDQLVARAQRADR